MKFSKFADKFVTQSGIGMLMDDLGNALRLGQNVYMLGGGNPAPIPEVQQFFRDRMRCLLAREDAFDRAVGNYDPPQGNPDFIEALADLLNNQFGWNVSSNNIALTHGSQQAFFILFNMFAGTYPDGSQKKILFPLAPEYIGYCDVGLSPNLLQSALPSIEKQDELFFKYHINFDALNVTDEIGAICVSRPTNPTGNVLTDSEISKLAKIAHDKKIPLIIDNAYGKPFPDIIYTDVKSYWDENVIICMSLSKLGLPGTRTGIVIGPPELIECISKINAVLTLSPGGMGTAIATELIRNRQVLEISKQTIKPFYQQKLDFAIECAKSCFSGLDFAIHQPEGSFFLWVWFKDMPISCSQLYQQLKQRRVIVVPGNYFFFGLELPHPHQDQCLRINYAQEPAIVENAFKIIADEIRNISV